MAVDIQRTIEILFNATDSTGTAIKSVSKGLGDVSKSVGNATQPIADLHDGVLALETALGALAIGGLALAVKAAGEFDKQFFRLLYFATIVFGHAVDFPLSPPQPNI